ncbi:unnamed protein product [Soboliphyme baturini]|uniref:BPI1 domain-containing protein n=1 Tax=Soboliphyme baturini TaxID=241478 RepID=A0A183IFE8_9BILA|nr:unnamed protein product [Soboliphyme baturini]
MLVQLTLLMLLFANSDTKRTQHHQPHNGTCSNRLAPSLTGGKAGNPGMEIVITDMGIRHCLDKGVKEVEMMVQNITIPNIKVNIPGAQVLLHDIYVSKASGGSYGYKLKNPNQILISFHSGQVELKGHWSYYETSKQYNVNGTFRGTTMNVTGYCNFALTRTASGAPQISNARTSVTILNDFEVEVHTNEKTNQSQETSRRMMERYYELPLEPLISKALKNYITGPYNSKIGLYSVQQEVGPSEASLTLNTALASNPTISKRGIEMPLKGQFKNLGVPFFPKSVERCNISGAYNYLLISDYVFNTLLHNAHNKEILKNILIDDTSNRSLPVEAVLKKPSVVQLSVGRCNWFADGTFKSKGKGHHTNISCGKFESEAECHVKQNGSQLHVELSDVKTTVTKQCPSEVEDLDEKIATTMKQKINDFFRRYNFTIPTIPDTEVTQNRITLCTNTAVVIYETS